MRFGSCSAGKFVLILSAAIITMSVAAWLGIVIFHNGGRAEFIDSTCKKTPYPEICISTLQPYHGGKGVNTKNFAQITLKASLDLAQETYSVTLKAAPTLLEIGAFDDCIALYFEAVEHLNRSMGEAGGLDMNLSKAQISNVKTWLSAALTDVETCLDGFRETTGEVMAFVEDHCQSLSKSISNALATFQIFFPDNGRFRPRRPLLNNPNFPHGAPFPPWMSRTDRRLLQVPASALHVNATVAHDGSGQYKTIREALRHVPSHSNERYVVYVKAGVYEENVHLHKEQTNVMFVGDGQERTIVSSSKNVEDGSTTFASATFGIFFSLFFLPI